MTEASISTAATMAQSPDPRYTAMQAWLSQRSARFGLALDTLSVASADASFRRYFRLQAQEGSLIVMDAPPEKESLATFVNVAEVFRATGVNVPQIHEADLEQGFALIEDFGNTTYLQVLNAQTQRALYADAHASLIRLQLGHDAAQDAISHQAHALPSYDRSKLRAEMDLFLPWYVEKHLQAQLSDEELQGLDSVFDLLLDRVCAQPQVLVHRDFHSRNLMVLPERNPGLLDFQDAVVGPITYDLVSLHRDAYIAWDEETELDGVVRYWERAKKAGLAVNPDFGEFWVDYECMGLQRHLKVLGIFARLFHRDGKSAYLDDLPTVLAYVMRVAKRYESLSPLTRILRRLHEQPVQTGYTF